MKSPPRAKSRRFAHLDSNGSPRVTRINCMQAEFDRQIKSEHEWTSNEEQRKRWLTFQESSRKEDRAKKDTAWRLHKQQVMNGLVEQEKTHDADLARAEKARAAREQAERDRRETQELAQERARKATLTEAERSEDGAKSKLRLQEEETRLEAEHQKRIADLQVASGVGCALVAS